jgi:adenylate cyclase
MTTRRLAAILAADVVGYSKLIGEDETATLDTLREIRRNIVNPIVAEHGGRVFKLMGDGLLAEFPSAVQAVRAAIGIQERLRQRNAAAPSTRIEVRIGIHQGDVVVEGTDLVGDGVNIAARLEPLAEPGAICISARVFEDAAGKLSINAQDMGEQALKNIARQVRAYRVAVGAPSSSEREASQTRPSLPLPDKPSLAVLPFQNMSGDPEQEYFADGMVEEIITALSRVRSFFVIARNSSFTYKGKAIDVKQVGRELGVRYVLEGSVRKAAGRVRIACQLIEAATNHHVWADRFEGTMEDVFDLQDRVAESTVAAIMPTLQLAEIERASAKPTESLDAYDCYLRALQHFYHLTRNESDTTLVYLRRAIDLDPNYAAAKAFYASTLILRTIQGWVGTTDKDRGVELAKEAVLVDRNDPFVLCRAGLALAFFARDYEQALSLVDRAVGLNPNSAYVLAYSAFVYTVACVAPDKAIEQFKRAVRLSPRDPDMGYYLSGLAFLNLIGGHDAEALRYSQEAQQELPGYNMALRSQIIALIRLGRFDEAKVAARRMLALDPGFTVTTWSGAYRDPPFLESCRSALRAAGLPE